MPLGRVIDVFYGSSNPPACIVPVVRGGAYHWVSRRLITPPFVYGQQACCNDSALFGRVGSGGHGQTVRRRRDRGFPVEFLRCTAVAASKNPGAASSHTGFQRNKEGVFSIFSSVSTGGLGTRLRGMLLPAGVTSTTGAALGTIGVVAPVMMWWLMQPFISARAYGGKNCQAEDVFWSIGPDGERLEKQAFPTVDSSPSKTLSVIVPAHNEQDRLSGMLKDTLAYLNTRRKKVDSSFTYEIIVVDDGSTDGTAAVVERSVKELGTDVIRLLTLKQNQGKGAAVRKGMLRMRGEYGIMVDADAATEIEDLDRLMIRMRDIQRKAVVKGGRTEKHGMVVGSRAHMEGEAVAKRAFHRTILMYVFHGCVAILCTCQIKDTQCGFKLFTRDTAKAVFTSLHLRRWAFDTELVYICQLLGIPMAEVAVNWREVPGSKLIRSKLDIITTSAAMLRDMLCVKICYMLGIWKVASSASKLPPRSLGSSKKRR